MPGDTVTLPLAGGCLCGQVRYALNGAPLLAYACHCHDCQTRSGSAFGLTVVVATADLAVTGELQVIRMTTPSGRELEHNLCPRCQVRVFVRAVAALDYASLRAGTFDDAGWIRPAAQMYVESAIPWAIIDGVPAVATTDFDFYRLGEAYRASGLRFVGP